MHLSIHPIKRVVFDPKEASVWYSHVSPVSDAFTHAVQAGAMVRDADSEFNTQNFEYLGDSIASAFRNRTDENPVTHHFRHNVTRKISSVPAPKGHVARKIERRHWQEVFNDKIKKKEGTLLIS